MYISLAILVARVKILPSEPGINALKIKPVIDSILPQGVIVRQITEEPIAFGLFTIFADIQFEDVSGALDTIEESLNKLNEISELETIAVSTTSTGVGE